MTPNGIVTLLTDFGALEPFVGVMKGVVLGRFSRATLVDLTHEIEPGRVGDAAFWLGNAFPWFPAGSVHLAVVDPGVGTERAAVVLEGGGHWFIGPDNGVFEVVLRRVPSCVCRRIDASLLGLPEPSRTFHGRDVFAPVAADLASGRLRFSEVGARQEALVTRGVPEARRGGDAVEGEVIVADRFGNLVTNVERTLLGHGARHRVEVCGRELPLVGTYGDVGLGDCAAVVGSFGQLELVQRGGSAARALGAQRGTAVRVHRFD